MPSDEDIVRWSVRTTGILTETIDIRGNSMTLLDFGGQRTERKKWIHGFQEAGIIFFVASLSDYNEVLIEDETTVRSGVLLPFSADFLSWAPIYRTGCRSLWRYLSLS